MAKTLNQLPNFHVWRNDRFWLAGDHVVDPRTYDTPLNRRLLAAADKVAMDHKLTEWKGPNYTILHTEFTRERAQPGQLILGSDSRAVGCLAIGLGAGDVAMGLVTGETWLSVPECINIRFINQPQLGIGGKDIILYILGKLKRNTVAMDRVVEFSGPGCQYLSVDARFAISNMCTEFGAITGTFIPDDITKAYVDGRRGRHHRSTSLYFLPDDDCQYAEVYEIDLSQIKPLFAVYPSPDQVVPVTDKVGMRLDGCFIGACTTTEEDLILAALVLQVGLRKQLPLAPGKRKVVPGSVPIRARLEALGLMDVYREAGFEIGAPGCSYCVGMGADQAHEGEVWLSSQNRNFKHRMGKGSIGNLSSATTVAASAFSMTVTDPTSFIEEIDSRFIDTLKARPGRTKASHITSLIPGRHVQYSEPNFVSLPIADEEQTLCPTSALDLDQTMNSSERRTGVQTDPAVATISSKVIRLGDFVDTDQIAPAESLVTCNTDEELAEYCMKHVMPDFRDKVRSGQRVVVAGKAMGCGSSREAAVRALKGLGVECVIARSFAFIFGRNAPNVGLLCFIIDDDSFFEAAIDGAHIEIRLNERVVCICDNEGSESGRTGAHAFPFKLSNMELSLYQNQGLIQSYQQLGKAIFKGLAKENRNDRSSSLVPEIMQELDSPSSLQELQW
ncbi:hypothetical protein AYO22_10453 [Fonsecaea multimorphosa]|nr:hypothetical protein AYO22_10453 [Fonsecaea multimorphosa]